MAVTHDTTGITNSHVLFVDDEQPLHGLLERIFKPLDVRITACSDAGRAMELLAEHEVNLVITDFKLPGMDGLELLQHIRREHPGIATVMVTAHASVQHAVRSMQYGADDYLAKPFSTTELVERVAELLRESPSSSEPTRTGTTAPNASIREYRLVGEHPSIQRIKDFLPRIAASTAPVFVHGESGTGKEIIARLVHRMSERAGYPFVALNCATLPSELVESHLFGHRKGAFTGAVTDVTGAFERANGGTLLLDEITEVDASIQAKLLRVLQEREIQRVGETTLVSVDVRIVATSNRELQQAIDEGEFREDLYHRLSVFPLTMPPLRERSSDIPLLAEFFVEKFCALYDLGPKTIASSLMRRLTSFSWPGNVRQLENMIHRGVVLAEGEDELKLEHVQVDAMSGASRGCTMSMTLEEMERQMILQTLKDTDFNQKDASQRLGISDRTIRNKLKKYRADGYFV